MISNSTSTSRAALAGHHEKGKVLHARIAEARGPLTQLDGKIAAVAHSPTETTISVARRAELFTVNPGIRPEKGAASSVERYWNRKGIFARNPRIFVQTEIA